MTQRFIAGITKDVFINRPSKAISIDVVCVRRAANHELFLL